MRNEIHITNPKLFSSPETPNLYDIVEHEMIAEIEIDGENVYADSYEWKIVDSDDNQIDIISQNENKMKWMPLNTDVYTVSCKVTSGNKSITEIERYTVEFFAPSLYKHLIGDWHATGKMDNGSEWKSFFTFAENNTYTSIIDTIISGDVVSSLGMVGDDYNYEGYEKYFFIMDKLENSNSFSGTIEYLQTTDNYRVSIVGNILDFEFTNELKGFNMTTNFIDYSVDSPRPNYIVAFNFLKSE